MIFLLNIIDNCVYYMLIHRSNIAVMLLSDLVLDGLEVDWSPHLPLMLHIIFLGRQLCILFTIVLEH